ncbi:alternate-type signal peptide domain-containing protein [Bogoriella caseilytica]|nr:alternate-type signal peptide domain-containing protein [Bogoriella caseilytica]
MTKGAVAIGAGVVLLLGGAGTYALWSVTETLDGAVATGDLNLELDGAGTWEMNGEAFDPATDHIVPGDTVTYTQALTVTAVGENLNARLSINEDAAIVPGGLEQYFDIDLAVDTGWDSDAAGFIVPSTDPGVPYEIEAVVTLEFDETTPNREGTTTDVDFGEIAFTLEQTPVS